MDGLIWWLIVGGIAGMLAGLVMKGGGYGVVVDIVLGIPGAFVGGWVFGQLGIGADGGIRVELISHNGWVHNAKCLSRNYCRRCKPQ